MCFITNDISTRVSSSFAFYKKKSTLTHTHIYILLSLYCTPSPGAYLYTSMYICTSRSRTETRCVTIKNAKSRESCIFSRLLFFILTYLAPNGVIVHLYTCAQCACVRAHYKLIDSGATVHIYIRCTSRGCMQEWKKEEKKKQSPRGNTISTSRFRINRKRRCASRVCDIVIFHRLVFVFYIILYHVGEYNMMTSDVIRTSSTKKWNSRCGVGRVPICYELFVVTNWLTISAGSTFFLIILSQYRVRGFGFRVYIFVILIYALWFD